jgi:hypothetical protein
MSQPHQAPPQQSPARPRPAAAFDFDVVTDVRPIPSRPPEAERPDRQRPDPEPQKEAAERR